jgi:hypothetical protein
LQNLLKVLFLTGKMVGLGELEPPTSPLSGVRLFNNKPYFSYVSRVRYLYCVTLVQQLWRIYYFLINLRILRECFVLR